MVDLYYGRSVIFMLFTIDFFHWASFMQVLGKDRSLQRWIFSKFKKLNNSSFSSTVSDILSALEGIIQSFKEAISVEGRLVDSDEDDPDSSKYVNQRYSVHRISNQHEHSDDPSGKKGNSDIHYW